MAPQFLYMVVGVNRKKVHITCQKLDKQSAQIYCMFALVTL